MKRTTVETNRSKARTFLTATWRYLAMLNYEIDPTLLKPYVPYGTELDTWQDRTFVSVVGFLFQNTRVLGVPVPFHINFEEVNLRFYVRRRGPEGWRRGVVFIKELVPRWAIATAARITYNENYQALPMRHAVILQPDGGVDVAYGWRFRGWWQGLHMQTHHQPQPLQPDTEEAFITEHYWGYAAQRDGGTIEYQVEHPPWRVWPAREVTFDCDITGLYGRQFVQTLIQEPASAFLAEGSAVAVLRGVRI